MIHDGNLEYTQHHPDAVVDSDKAKAMAYASKTAESMVGFHSDNALNATEHLGDPNYEETVNPRSKGGYRLEPRTLNASRAANHHAKLAAKERATADYQAKEAAAVYDRVNALKKGEQKAA